MAPAAAGGEEGRLIVERMPITYDGYTCERRTLPSLFAALHSGALLAAAALQELCSGACPLA